MKDFDPGRSTLSEGFTSPSSEFRVEKMGRPMDFDPEIIPNPLFAESRTNEGVVSVSASVRGEVDALAVWRAGDAWRWFHQTRTLPKARALTMAPIPRRRCLKDLVFIIVKPTKDDCLWQSIDCQKDVSSRSLHNEPGIE